jgi:sulfate adenylyltransferase
LNDNAASPHGGTLVERMLDLEAVPEDAWRAPQLPVRDEIATECIDIACGVLSPLEGFMGSADLDAVVHEMRLSNGLVWSIPIVLDLNAVEVAAFGVTVGETFLLTHRDRPLATLEVEEVYSYDHEEMALCVYGTTDREHPGVRRTRAYGEHFVAGKVTLLGRPRINPPFDACFRTPRELRELFAQKGWQRIVAFQTRNVPHVGHEWLMKSAWLMAHADGILDNPVIGEKKEGDAIDEAILAGHEALVGAGYFKPDVHLVSALLWDMRYAGPREAVFHALARKNMGCTHHAFGRDHAGVGSFYEPFAAQRIFDTLPDIGIEPVFTEAWGVCDKCGPAYARFCDHGEEHQKKISGTWVRGLIRDGGTPDCDVFRPEVFAAMLAAGEQHGFGSPFVSREYLQGRTPVFEFPTREAPVPDLEAPRPERQTATASSKEKVKA